MQHIWDYEPKSIVKSKIGRFIQLERLINMGIYLGDREKIQLWQVKKHWNELHIEPKRRRLLEFLIWGK